MSDEKKQNMKDFDQTEEQEIDLMEIARKIWNKRKLIYKVCGIALLLGLVIAFSIPKEYTTAVKLSSERTNSRSGGGLSSLAAMAGINLSSSNSDALSDQIYPDVMASTPFLKELFKVQIKNKDGNTTLYNYLLNNYRSPWWSSIIRGVLSIPSKIIDLFKSKKEVDNATDPEYLSKDDRKVISRLSENLNLSVDQKTGVMDLTVTMQDPNICAQVTDTVIANLQKYITTYRTNKARKDLAYSQNLYEEAKSAYTKAQNEYANFTDANQNLILHSYRAEQERLQNEMNLAYQTYSQTSQQLQAAKAKVQENTPAFAVIQPAIVPMRASKPKKMIILVGFLFLGFMGACTWVYFEDQIKEWKKQITASEPIVEQKKEKA